MYLFMDSFYLDLSEACIFAFHDLLINLLDLNKESSKGSESWKPTSYLGIEGINKNQSSK